MNPFKKIFDQGMAFFARGASDSSVIGVDIGTSAIKIVELKKKGGRAVLETYGSLSLGPYAKLDVGAVTNLSTADLSKALTDVVRESGATVTTGGFSIPSTSSLIFLIDLPAIISDKELDSVIPTEARKYIPVPISEVMLDYWAIPKKEEHYAEGKAPEQKTEVLLAAIHNETISKYKSVVSTAGLHANFFEIEMFSAIRGSFSHELSPVLLIDFGASRTKLAIVEYGIIKSFHVVNRGSQDITNALSKSLGIPFPKAEEMKREFGLNGSSLDKNIGEISRLTVDFILAEANAAILAYERKYNKSVSRVILSGGGSLLKGFGELAHTNFAAEVIVANPFNKITAPAFLETVLATIGPEFSIAAGLALRELQ